MKMTENLAQGVVYVPDGKGGYVAKTVAMNANQEFAMDQKVTMHAHPAILKDLIAKGINSVKSKVVSFNQAMDQDAQDWVNGIRRNVDDLTR